MDRTSISSGNLAKRFYIPRIIASFFGFIAVYFTFNELDVDSQYYVIPFFQGLLWPHISYLLAKDQKNHHLAERRNLMIDCFLAFIIVPIMSFNVLTSCVLASTLMMNNINAGGFKLCLRGLAAKCLGMLIGIAAVGFQFSTDINLTIVLACLPIIVLYPIALANVSFHLSKALHKKKKAFEKLSRIDYLTNIPNRAFWQSTLDKEFSRQRRYSKANNIETSSLIMMDIDHFKQINDNYGHTVGDEVIQSIGHVLAEDLRQEDTAGRYGGEEFGILLPNTPVEGAHALAERVRQKVMSLDFPSAPDLNVTISLGVACFTEDMKTSQVWISEADKALYQAKESGRNQTIIRDEDSSGFEGLEVPQ